MVELLIFMKWNFKTNLDHKSLALVMGSDIILGYMLKLTKNRRKRFGYSGGPIKCNKISSSPYLKPDAYHDLEKMEINEFNFLSPNEMQINFCMCYLALNCHACDNRTSKRPVINNQAVR